MADKKTKSSYAAVVGSMTEGVLVFDGEGRVLLGNERAGELMDIKGDPEKMSLQLFMLDRQGRYDAFVDAVSDAIYKHQTCSNQTIDFTLNGRQRHYFISTSYLDQEDDSLEILAVINDVTDAEMPRAPFGNFASAAMAKATWEITDTLRGEENLDDALSKCLEIIVETIGCEAGSVWFLHSKENRVQAAFNVGEESIVGISVENGQGVVGTVTSEGRSILIKDVEKDSRFSASVDEETETSTRSIIAVPLKDSQRIIGAIEVINKTDGAFDNSDLTLCEQMALMAAVAIEDRGFDPSWQETQKPLISLKNVIKEYPVGDGVLQVLKGINLDIYEDEFLVVLGESGCGKSTLMNIVGGMDEMTGGSLTVEGKDFSKPDEQSLTRYRRDYIGFIFQSYNLMPNLTALQNVAFVAEISKNPLDSRKAIEMVGLSERADNYPAQMSGGQQQRVSIARAIVKRPKLILADEPTAALDFETSVEVLSVIQNVAHEQGTTVMMITHNTEIAKLADRVIKLKSGRVSSIKRNMNPLPASEVSW